MYNIAPIRHLKCPHKTMVIIIDIGPAASMLSSHGTGSLAPYPWHGTALVVELITQIDHRAIWSLAWPSYSITIAACSPLR